MTGVSWGGFACVQAAARTPPALKAIAPLHFTDDRYADDVHYRGGWSVRAEVTSRMTCTREAFLVTTTLDAYDGGPALPRAPLDTRDPEGRWLMGTATSAARHTLPWSWYEDPGVARRERDLIFRRAWQYAGRRDQLTAPGSYVATHVGGLPVVLTRDRDDTLRAFANVCRHRGAIVAHGAGERGTLQCPYHAWTYGLDGCLRGAPRTRDDPGFDAAGLGLVPMAAGTWGPFVFVNPDAGAAPLAEALGDLPDVVARHGLDVDALVFHHRAEYEVRANWKVAIENYLECYHCQLNHPGLVSVIDDRALRFEATGLRASQFNPAEARALAGEAPLQIAGGVDEGQFHLLFPALKFNVYPGPANLSIGPVWPTGPSSCRGYLDYWFAADADPAWIADMTAFDDQVGAEDVGLVEAVQAGAGSGLVPEGRLLAHDEQLIARFQAYVRDALEG
jgi:phenylpropionate dioxygenase-like ring-hydroxylating dioxygenase large terminal subunit